MTHSFPDLQPYVMHTVKWEDERYSQDMTELFQSNFKARFPMSNFISEDKIPYSLGGFFHASPQEQAMVGSFLARPTPVKPHSLLVLPTQTVRMRGFLLNLRQRSPADARNLVVLNGDAISFNSVYRDREVVWNILDLPYSLVFFTHRNPIDHAAGFTWTKGNRAADTIPPRTSTGTQDLLLYRDVFEAFLYAAFDQRQPAERSAASAPPAASVTLASSARRTRPKIAARVAIALHQPTRNRRAFFDADGNRRGHTGEHIVWIKPNFTEDRVDLVSKISVWAMQPNENGGAWRLLEAIDATYNQSHVEEGQ